MKKLNKIIGIVILTMILILLVSAPYIIFVVLPNNEIVKQMFSKDATDVLGYYGALSGGFITVFGIYFTLKHEKEKAVIELQRNSLPILRFSITDELPSDYGINGYIHIISDLNLRENYEKKSESLFEISGITKLSKSIVLEIRNIGLQTAILSSIKFLTKKSFTIIPKYTKDYHDFLGESGEVVIDGYSVPREGKTRIRIIFDYYFDLDDEEFDEILVDGGQLEINYTDLYSNGYKYIVPVKLDVGKSKKRYSIIIRGNQIPVLPQKVNS